MSYFYTVITPGTAKHKFAPAMKLQMTIRPLIAYFTLLTVISGGIILTISVLGQKGLYFAQFYMMAPAIAAIITRLFFYDKKFSDAYLTLGQGKHWLQFWLISVILAATSYLFYTLFGAVTWDPSGQAFLDKLADQFSQAGQKMEDTLPKGFTPHNMLTLFVIGNFTIFNILPGLITGMGEELGHRGIMFKLIAEKNLKTALIVGGIVWFLWHLPLGFVMPVKYTFTNFEIAANVLVQTIGSICTHTWLAYVLIKTKSIWITALAHITFNNVSTALSFFVTIENQTVANIGLVLTMLIAVMIGFWKFRFWETFTTAFRPAE